MESGRVYGKRFVKIDLIEIPKQEFKPFERKGFTVVEWSGTQLEISLKGCDNLEYKEVKWIAIGNRVLCWWNRIFFLLILMASVYGIWLLYEQYGFPNISTIRLYVPLYVSMACIGVGLTCIMKVMFSNSILDSDNALRLSFLAKLGSCVNYW